MRGLRAWPQVLDRLTTAIDAAVPSQSPEHFTGWTLDVRLYEAAYRRYGDEIERFEKLPRPVRAVVKLFLVLVIKVWQIFRR
jgi:hypothetical protein